MVDFPYDCVTLLYTGGHKLSSQVYAFEQRVQDLGFKSAGFRVYGLAFRV